MKNSDFIVILAWPEGMVNSAGSWYDRILLSILRNLPRKKLSKNGQYRVGHSALILVNSETNKLHYMDFGRYQNPEGFGRVRDAETDPDIGISLLADIKHGNIININDILIEIANKEATHGVGTLYASVLKEMNFNNGYHYAKKMQEKGALAYGPFVRKGSNCSRFVSKIIRKSGISLVKRLRLKIQANITPSPKRNIAISNSNFFKVENNRCIKITRNKIKAYFIDIEKENA